MGFTTRYPEVTLRWTDEQGETHEQAFDGMDHLNGIFFTDRIESGPQTEKAALAELAIRRASTNSTQE